MVIGILPDASTTETFLNNLSEADFDLNDVSVLMRNLKTRNAIAKDTGPLKGATFKTLLAKLVALGLSDADAQPYVQAVAKNQVLVVARVPQESEPAAAEMFKDVQAQFIRTLANHETA